MCGSATLAMEVSSTSMKVARVTVKAMSHGLWRGRQAATSKDWSAVTAAVATMHLGLRETDDVLYTCMYVSCKVALGLEGRLGLVKGTTDERR